MRQLRLQHEWQLGDWYWNESTGHLARVGKVGHRQRYGRGSGHRGRGL